MQKLSFILLFLISNIVQAQDLASYGSTLNATTLNSQLSQDAYYGGAYISAEQPVTFYSSGQLAGGLLKADFTQNSYVFKQASAISFFENGQVKAGTLSKDLNKDHLKYMQGSYVLFWSNGQIRNATLLAASRPNNRNLVLPVDMEVQFNADGQLSSATPYKNVNYSVFDYLLKGQSQFVFDPASNQYFLYKGILAEARIIASVITENNNAIAVIAPRNASFSLYQPNSVYIGAQQPYDSYFISDTFRLNGVNYGKNAILYVRHMLLKKIQPGEGGNYLGKDFKAGEIINIDGQGRPAL